MFTSNSFLSGCKFFTCIISTFAMLFNLIFGGFAMLGNVVFKIDGSSEGSVLGNKVSNINLWAGNRALGANTTAEKDYDVSEFVEYIQLMQATGGNESRDLFVNPNDRSVLDDYDFSSLISACRGILNIGAKPHIKTGNVPLKYSTDAKIGTFGVNLYQPDDYNVYYDYIYAIGQALVDEFGRDEVRTWRFGVFTEYENESWFLVKSKQPHETYIEFCKIFDYTVAALQASIDEDVFISAHSMTVADGAWDECDFIRHCANGTNAKTGKVGTKLDALSISYYDTTVGLPSNRTVAESVAIVRNAAEEAGLNNLIYGVDEGRMLVGLTSGAISSELFNRTVGYTYQAAYDARLIKQLIDNDIDYFSMWGYLSGGAFSGYPTVSYHVAKLYHEMSASNRLSVDKTDLAIGESEVECVSGFDSNSNTLHVMAYNFKDSLNYRKTVDLSFRIDAPQFANKQVTVKCYKVDDDCNYFDEWCEDRKTYNITDDCFSWSPDDPCIDNDTTLSAKWAKDLYSSTLRDKYIECSKLEPVITTAEVDKNGKISLDTSVDPNSVVFYEICE